MITDIIQLLPDAVANQIAAGEVIQRPASLVKELVENAIDAGSTNIQIIVKDSGRTLIQIIDNGSGMSETDARLSFERHATSKIRSATDLFAIRTMGFRGEALASIAAVAQVEMKTKRKVDDVGTCIEISGSVVESQQPCNCSDGSSFSVKNLFFNVPARRKFLKSNNVEFRHILDEFHRIVLANPDITFSLFHNNEEIYNLPATSLKQRIVTAISKNLNQSLIAINTETSLINIRGFIGKPEFAKKSSGEQYFFVNNRYMKNPYFYRAVLNAYERILPPETQPSFFLFFNVNPENIDINIHPTKTEIKFTDENAIFQIIQAAVRETLGKHNVVPSIDFEIESLVEIPQLTKDTDIVAPDVHINHEFNPFAKQKTKFSSSVSYFDSQNKSNLKHWEKLYEDVGKKDFPDENIPAMPQVESDNLIQLATNAHSNFFQFKTKYILTPVKSGLMVIDQKRAHERILYEKYVATLELRAGFSQRILFPKTFDLNTLDASILQDITDDLHVLGFEISELGKNTFAINGIPADFEIADPEGFLISMLDYFKNCEADIKISAREKIALSLAKANAIWYNKPLTVEQMQNLCDNLFACSVPNYTADGNLIVTVIMDDEFEKRLKK